MTTLARRLILVVLGILGGLALWPVTEAILFLQQGFASYAAFRGRGYLYLEHAVVFPCHGVFAGVRHGFNPEYNTSGSFTYFHILKPRFPAQAA